MSVRPGKTDQPRHPPSLIRVFAICMKKPWALSYPLSTQGRLIRLGRCPGWSELSLCAESFCWFCHDAAHLISSGLCVRASLVHETSQVLLVSGEVVFSQGCHHNLQLAWLKMSEIILKACNIKSMHGMLFPRCVLWLWKLLDVLLCVACGFYLGCFMLSLALLLVLGVFQSFPWGGESWSMCFLCICLFIYRHWFLSFSSSWCREVAAVCDCGSSWTFL